MPKATIFLLFIFGLCVGGCSGMKQAMLNTTDTDLKEKVSYDTGCPPEKIKIVDRMEKEGFADYKIEACGERLDYKRTGSVFHPAEESPF